MKRCLKSMIIREMQIKTILRYHPTTVRMAIIKKKKSWPGHGQKGNLYTVGGNEIAMPLLKIVWSFSIN